MATQKKNNATKTEQVTTNHGLDNRAMLVDLSIGNWEGRKKDKDTSKEVIADAGAKGDAGSWWTRTVPPESLRALGAAINRGRTVHFRRTMPWSDSGPRILSAEMYFEYTKEIREVEAEFNKAVEEFLAEYPKLVEKASERLGELFKIEYYPTVKELRQKFYWRVNFLPIPTAGDFRVDLGGEEAEEIRKSITSQMEASMTKAMSDLWTRLHSAVSKIAERLGDAEGVFRDSLIENAKELCDLLPKMNITGNKDLEAMRVEVLKKLAEQDPETLRKNKTARADTAKTANDILKKMSAFMPAKA